MATIVVRGLEPAVHRELKVLAARRGRSMEEEVRQMLRERLTIPAQRSLAETLMSVPGYGWAWPKPR